MIEFLRSIFRLAYTAGGIGLLSVGVLDSSILMLPLGNDFLMLGLSARHPHRFPYYAAMATLGSVLGTLLTVWLSSKGAEKVASKKNVGKRMRSLQHKVEEHAGWALALASVMPPPFPFTFFVAVAAALHYPKKKLLAVVAGGRAVRFAIEGLLAVKYGRWILSLAQSPRFKYFIIAVAVLSIGGTAYSIYQWLMRSRTGRSTRPEAA